MVDLKKKKKCKILDDEMSRRSIKSLYNKLPKPKGSLNNERGIYLAEGLWLFPNGEIKEW